MNRLIHTLIKMIDYTVHPDVKKRGGMPLLRSRMLSFSSAAAIPVTFGLIVVIALTRGLSIATMPFVTILLQFIVILCLNRWIRRGPVVAAINLVSISILLSLGICMQARSLLAPGFFWFPMLMMPNFLLCGRRLGIVLSLFMMLIAIVTIAYTRSYGVSIPFHNDTVAGVRAQVLTLILANFLTLVVIIIYFYLLHDGERKTHAQKTWIQRTARMQELLQMSGHFALQTNRPLDVLGTALHNLEDPLEKSLHPRTLLPLLEPVEASIRDLAAVARSFSLFSRRYLQEGLEQTSFNVIFQHVDMIYNVGKALPNARLNWSRLDQDIPIHTQTAKLVMLIVSLLRRIAAEDAQQLSVDAHQEAAGLVLNLRYRKPSSQSVRPRETATSELVFDPELTEDLIRELCTELGVHHSQQSEGEQYCERLQLPLV